MPWKREMEGRSPSLEHPWPNIWGTFLFLIYPEWRFAHKAKRNTSSSLGSQTDLRIGESAKIQQIIAIIVSLLLS